MTYGTGAFGTFAYSGTGDDGSLILTESVTVTGSPTVAAMMALMTEALAMTSGAAAEREAQVLDALQASDSLDILLVHALRDQVALTPTLYAQGLFLANLSESMAVHAVLRPVLQGMAADGLAVTDAGTAEILRTVAIRDGLALLSALTPSLTVRPAEAMAVAAALRLVAEGQVTEEMVTGSLLTALASLFAGIQDPLVLADEVAPMATITALVGDGLDLGDEVLPIGKYLAAIAEGTVFSVSFVMDGVPFFGMAMNSETRAISEYRGFNFNSLANLGGTLYGANEFGLFRLDGNTDNGNPIDAFARTALQRIAGGRMARVDCAYVGYRSNGQLQMKVIISDSDGEKKGYVYDMVQVPATTTRPNRVKFGRGMKAAYWAFELHNIAGADFAADVIEIHPLPLERRVP